MVGDAAQYPWSSARAHLAGHDDLGLLDDWEWSECGLRQGWAETLRAGMNEEQVAALRAATDSGVPIGDDGFVSRLEQDAGRRLRPARRGPAPQASTMASGAAAG
jgi:putative transposase